MMARRLPEPVDAASGWAIAILVVIAWLLFWWFTLNPAYPHDVYTGLHGKSGQLCCGGNDCAATIYREQGGDFEFLTRESRWVKIPPDRITFLPVPGDSPSDDSHRAHLCYRNAVDEDREGAYAGNVFGDIYLYCAFIPPGGV